GRAHAQAPRGEVEPVEALRELDNGLVAVASYLRDDGAHCPIDVLRNLAFAGEKGSKRAVEAGVTGGEMQRHGCWGPRLAPPASAGARWGWVGGGVLRHRPPAPPRAPIL